MNANELKINGNTLEDFLQTSREVDEYDNLDCRICAADSVRQLVDFVRQQQSEIEALKDDKLKYAEAVVEALEWGSYAGDYSKWNDIVSKLRKAQE